MKFPLLLATLGVLITYCSGFRARRGVASPVRAPVPGFETWTDSAGPGTAQDTRAKIDPSEAVSPYRTDATMPTPELVPADGDPPEDPAAAALARAQRVQPREGDTPPRTEHPVPDSLPSGGATGANA